MVRKANPPSQLTRDLLSRFDELLWTFDLRQAERGQLFLEAVTVRRRGGNWQQVCEAKYGDGQYEDRKWHLHSTLADLERRGTDLETVYTVLAEARYEYITAHRTWRGKIRGREQEERRQQIVKHLQHSLRDALQFFAATGYGDPATYPPPEAVPRLVQYVRRLLRELDPRHSFNILSPPFVRPGTSLRQPRTGGMEKTWLKDAEWRLGEVNVPPRFRRRLFECIGLRPRTVT